MSVLIFDLVKFCHHLPASDIQNNSVGMLYCDVILYYKEIQYIERQNYIGISVHCTFVHYMTVLELELQPQPKKLAGVLRCSFNIFDELPIPKSKSHTLKYTLNRNLKRYKQNYNQHENTVVNHQSSIHVHRTEQKDNYTSISRNIHSSKNLKQKEAKRNLK